MPSPFGPAGAAEEASEIVGNFELEAASGNRPHAARVRGCLIFVQSLPASCLAFGHGASDGFLALVGAEDGRRCRPHATRRACSG